MLHKSGDAEFQTGCVWHGCACCLCGGGPSGTCCTLVLVHAHVGTRLYACCVACCRVSHAAIARTALQLAPSCRRLTDACAYASVWPVHNRHAAPSQGVSRVNTDCFGPAWSVMRRLQWVLFQLVFVMQFVIVGM